MFNDSQLIRGRIQGSYSRLKTKCVGFLSVYMCVTLFKTQRFSPMAVAWLSLSPCHMSPYWHSTHSLSPHFINTQNVVLFLLWCSVVEGGSYCTHGHLNSWGSTMLTLSAKRILRFWENTISGLHTTNCETQCE